jgi:cellulose synthase/poly-beta-1,6-N-acetylglucosamine synthase-like glycosyltransferase
LNGLESVAAGALILLAYTYFGYPLLLGLLARLFPWRPRPDPTWEPTVSLCVAAYNAEAYIEAKLQSLVGQVYPADKEEILVYSDGSTDGTESIVAAWARRDPRVHLVRGETRQGKPTALNRMREQATGEVLVITDARQSLDPGALRALLSLLAAPEVGCVTGNLVLDGAEGSGVYWRYENWIRKHESRFSSLVGVTGALAALRRRDLGPLAVDLVLDDMWIAMQTRLRRARVLLAEGAIVHDRSFSDGREFGRKARSLAGNYQLFSRMPRLLLPLVNPSWFETISHKITRLLCPWAMLALLLACAAGAIGPMSQELATATLRWLLLVQVVFYALAALGARAGRIGVLARTFVVLNAAALVGLWRFVAGRQKITW